MKKKLILVLLLCMSVILGGCTSALEAETEENELRQSKEEVFVDVEITTEEQEQPTEEIIWEDMHASTVLEDDMAVYVCGIYNILRMDKESGEFKLIWETSEEMVENDPYAYSGIRGVLVENKIYFMEKWTENSPESETVGSNRALSVVCTDGSGYERIEKIVGERNDNLILLDGILYFDIKEGSKTMIGYPLDSTGELMRTKRVETTAENVPDGYMELYYAENGSRILTAIEGQKRFGYYLLHDIERNLCKVIPQTGEVEKLPGDLGTYHLGAMNEKAFLCFDYADQKLYLVDNETWESRLLLVYDELPHIISMNEEYLYIKRNVIENDFSRDFYEQINLATGECKELFVIDEMVGILDAPLLYTDVSVHNDFIYYVGERDYKLYLMRRNLKVPIAEEVLGISFYDSGISEIGEVKTYRETIYSTVDPERVTGEINLEWLVVDSRFPGASNINRILEEEQEQNISYEKEMALGYESLIISEEEIAIPNYSFSGNLSPIYYMDGTYMSFCEEYHDYTGGAHGMPYWRGRTFDLQTGKELFLSDIVADDVTVIKSLVQKYFTEMYNTNPGKYWDGTVDYVYESIDMESLFYLNEEGIVFYFGPYELAAYAEWFQEVVVPYEEFELKLPLVY